VGGGVYEIGPGTPNGKRKGTERGYSFLKTLKSRQRWTKETQTGVAKAGRKRRKKGGGIKE